MKFILFLSLLLPNLLYAQKSIKGIVTTSSNEPISNATVFIQNNNSLIIKFTKTDFEGKFVLQNFDLQSAALLRISHINFKQFSKKIELLPDTLILIQLIKDSAILNEVIVNTKIPPVRTLGDTTRYHLPSFINGSETRFEDILKKLPGIIVDDYGKLSFNGKPIDKVLIEGQDFFSKDYTLITKTLSAELIASIEAIENFNEEFFFSDIKKGDETVLNVGIKKNIKLDLFGELGGSIGTYKDWQLANSLFSLSGNKQIGVINNYNNYGEDIKPTVSEQTLIKEKLKNPQNLSYSSREIPITNFTPLSTNVNNNRNIWANVGVSTVQLNTKIGKSFTLKSLLTFKKNNLEKREIMSSTLINTASLLYIDSGKQSTRYNTISTENNLEYLINKNNKIKIEATISGSGFASDNNLTTKFSGVKFNSYYLSQNDNKPYYFKGTYLRKIGNTNLLEVAIFKLQNRNDYSITSFTNRYNGLLGIDSNTTDISQFVKIIDQQNGINTNVYKKILNHKIIFSSSFIRSNTNAESYFDYKSSSNTYTLADPLFTNNVHMETEMLLLSIKDDWSMKNFFSSMQLSWQNAEVNIIHKNTGLLNSFSVKGIRPNFLFGYKINGRNKIGFIYSSYNQINDILSYMPGYIQQNPNYFNNGKVEQGSVKAKEFGISHTYNDFFNNGWKAISGFTYSQRENPVFNSSKFTNTSIFRSRENANLPQQGFGVNFSVDKYLSFLRSTLSISTNVQKVVNFDNNSVPNFKKNIINYFTIKSSLKSGYKTFLNFYTSFELNSTRVNVLQKNDQIFSTNRITNLIFTNTLFIKFSDKLYGDVSNEFANFKYGGSLSKTNYCNLHFFFKPSNSPFSFHLFGRNIFNNSSQITNDIVAPFIVNNNLPLLPRTLILSANLKL